jgi:hypothetical protein
MRMRSVPEWDSEAVRPGPRISVRVLVVGTGDRAVFISVDRGPDQSLQVRFGAPADTGRLHIRVAEGVSAGEGTRALFESGAAVQQLGADYLISADWLRRQAMAGVEDLAVWEARFAEFLAAAAGQRRYVESADAVRTHVIQPSARLPGHEEPDS